MQVGNNLWEEVVQTCTEETICPTRCTECVRKHDALQWEAPMMLPRSSAHQSLTQDEMSCQNYSLKSYQQG